MNLAITLFEYFPSGGLQRDCLHIALGLLQHGHKVSVFTRSWEGDVPEGIQVTLVPVRAWTNVGRDEAFIDSVADRLHTFDGVIGFNKMPGLDVYYAADPCHAQRVRERGALHRLMRRNRLRIKWESCVFGERSKTHVLLLAHSEKSCFQEHHAITDERFHLLPPNLTRDRVAPGVDGGEAVRRELGLAAEDPLLLFVGSSFRTKGLDRAIHALASLGQERAHLAVIGRGEPGSYKRLSKALGVGEQVTFLGQRMDVPNFYSAAELLLHPARYENTGTVLLEALASGLPVIASAECGFAQHVREAGAGVVLERPFSQADLDGSLAAVLVDEHQLRSWSKHGRAYGEAEGLYQGHESAVRAIESVVGIG